MTQRLMLAALLLPLALGACKKDAAPEAGPSDGPRLKITVEEGRFNGDKGNGSWKLPITVQSWAEFPVTTQAISFSVMDGETERCTYKTTLTEVIPVGGTATLPLAFDCPFVHQPTLNGTLTWAGPNGKTVMRKFTESTTVSN